MKKLTTILFTILGIIMMANAASFTAPGIRTAPFQTQNTNDVLAGKS